MNKILLVLFALVLTGCGNTRRALAYTGPVITDPIVCPNSTTKVQGARVAEYFCDKNGDPIISLVDDSTIVFRFKATETLVEWTIPWHILGGNVDKREFSCRLRGDNPDNSGFLIDQLERFGSRPISDIQTITMICHGDAQLTLRISTDP